MDRRAWRATVHGVTKSWTRLSNQAQHSNINQTISHINVQVSDYIKASIVFYGCVARRSTLDREMTSRRFFILFLESHSSATR